MSLLSGPTLSLKLAEPHVFVTTPNRGAHGRTNTGPALVRGLLVLKLPKATKITSIVVNFDGMATTEWPEGIGPRRIEVTEAISLVSLRTSFLDSASTDRRALSLGPGIRFDDYEVIDGEDDDFRQSLSSTADPSRHPPDQEPDRRSSQLYNDHETDGVRLLREQSGDPLTVRALPQRAASALPAYDRRLFSTEASRSPIDETPPYTPRVLEADLARPSLPQSPIQAEGLGETSNHHDASNEPSSGVEHIQRGREPRAHRSVEEIPGLASRRHSFHEDIFQRAVHGVGPSSAMGLTIATDVVDQEDHPMSVIPEDPDGVQGSNDPSVVNVNSMPNTAPASSASSINLDAQQWQSSSSSFERSSVPASPAVDRTSFTNLNITSNSPTTSRPTSSLPALTPLQPQLSRHSTSSYSSNSRPSTPHDAHSPLPPMSRIDGSVDRRSLSPTVSSLRDPSRSARVGAGGSRSPAPTTNGRAPSANGTRSPSRGRSSHNPGRFSLGSVTQMLREVSQEVRDAVGIGADRRSRSRMTEQERDRGRTVVSHSRAPSVAEDHPGTNVDGSFIRAYGRGGAGSSRTRSRTRDRDDAQGRERGGREREEDEYGTRRGRDATVNPLGDAQATVETAPKSEGWKEFRKGTYTYPISFAIPPHLPPSIHCDFGSVSYRLKATVHRAGTFAPKITASTDVNLVSCLAPDATDDMDNIIVQKAWEDKLSYVVHVEGSAFPIGGTVPVNVTIMPLEKVSLYRLNVGLDEKIDYYAHGRKVARHEPVTHYEIVALRHEDKHKRLLPILSDSASSASSSPLAPYARPLLDQPPDLVIPPSASTESLERTSDVVSHLLNPSGPWHFRFEVPIPDCHSGIHFTNKGPGTRIVVLHRLKTVLRVGAGVSEDSKEKPKLFDIIIETPIHLLSCQCQSSWTSLPTYSQLAQPLTSPAANSGNKHDEHNHHHHHFHHPNYRRNQPILVPAIGPSRPGTGGHIPFAAHTGGHSHANMFSHVSSHGGSIVRAPISPSINDDATAGRNARAESSAQATARAAAAADALQRSEQFARLVAGQETESGEQPPAYASL